MLNLTTLPDGRKAVIIRTSDRIAFKQCRRRWGWSSHLKANLGAKNLAAPLWFGSAIHYALEDFHGYQKFGRASNAFRAFCIATSKQDVRKLPLDANELYDLGIAMMDYYQDHWLAIREPTLTYWHGGEPQVEVNFEIEVPIHEHPLLAAHVKALGADCVLYRGTIDRVGIDDYGNLWVVEYKTAKRAEHGHYMTDPQVSTYAWAASHIYDKPIAGIIYYQFVKNEPKPPSILSTGKLSKASNLVTSVPLYSSALRDFYGSVTNAPKDYQEFLANISRSETEHSDRYIQRERITRNEHQMRAEAEKILLELEDMLNPDLALYPNPTRQCPYMCGFMAPCVTMDDGGDWETELAQEFDLRDQAPDRWWRRRLPDTEKLQALVETGLKPDLESLQQIVRSASDEERAKIEAGLLEVDIPFTW